MKIIERESDSYLVRLSDKELDFIKNAINEVCNGIEVPEFHTRLGLSPEQATELLNEIDVESKRNDANG